MVVVVVVVVGLVVDITLTINGGSVTTWTGITTSRGLCEGLTYLASSLKNAISSNVEICVTFFAGFKVVVDDGMVLSSGSSLLNVLITLGCRLSIGICAVVADRS